MQFDSTIKEFRFSENGLKEIRKQILLRVIPIMAVAATTGIVMSYIGSKNSRADFTTLPITIAVMAGVLGFSIFRSLKKQKALLQSYTLTITNTVIGREQLNTPTVTIPLDNIRSIEKKKKGAFIVRGEQQHDVIYILRQIDNYEELEKELNRIKPISDGSAGPIWKKLRLLTPLLVIASMLCVYTINNKIVVAISGVLLIALLSWSFYEGQRSKNIDRKTKRNMWWSVLVLVSVIVVMITKLRA